MDPPDVKPLFCVKAKDEKEAGMLLFMNFKSTNIVEYPDVDLDENSITKEVLKSSSFKVFDNYKIPVSLSPIYWTKERDNERHYVIDVLINDKFAIRRVLVSDVIRVYVILVVMGIIDAKYKNGGTAKLSHNQNQFLGHEIELDQGDFQVLETKQCMDKSTEIVNNRIIFIEKSKKSTSSETETNDTPYDLYFRPASKLLTCSIHTDKLPDSIGFNEDRIIVKLGENSLMDVYLPFFIDLNEPLKYKFDDKLCLFRVVFKIIEFL